MIAEIPTEDENAQRRRRRRERETATTPPALSSSRELRRAIIDRDGPACYLCGLTFDPAIPGLLTLDHVVPLARGGAHSPANLRIACAVCNCRKGDRLLEELDWYPAAS